MSRSGSFRKHASTLACCGALVAAVCLAYGNTLDAGFHLDDMSITQAENLRMKDLSWSSIKGTFYGMQEAYRGIDRPVSYFSFGLNYYFGGLEVRGFHVVNITIHAITAILLFLTVKATLLGPRLAARYAGDATGIALFSALLWAVHPVQTQAVTYIIQRMTSMAAMFFLASLLAFIAGWRSRGWRKPLAYGGSVVFGLLAFGTKEHTVFLPVVILVFHHLFLAAPDSDRRGPRRMRRQLPMVVLAGIVLVGAGLLLDGGRTFEKYILNIHEEFHRQNPFKGFSPYERLISEPRVLFDYLGLLVFPALSRMNASFTDYPKSSSLLSPPTTLAALIALGGLVLAALLSRRRAPLFSFAIFWFLVNSAVEASFLPLFLYFEHRIYLPSMWLFVLVPAAAYRLDLAGLKRHAPAAALSLLAVVLALLTYQRNFVWTDEYTLWKDVVTKSPGVAPARNHYAIGLMERGEIDRAIEEYRKAISISPGYGDAYSNLGTAYLKKGELRKAVETLRTAITLQQGSAYGLGHGYYNLGLAYQKLGRHKEAREAFEKSRSFAP